jgi:hypothetical protein
MKKLFVLLVVLFVLPVALAQVAGSANLRITLVNQEPDPVEPGNIVDVRFKVENLGGGTVDDVAFEVIEQYPFSILPGDNATQMIGSVWGRQIGETGIIVKFRLKVADDAVSGDNGLKVRTRISYNAWAQEEFDIRIGAADKVLFVSNVETIPEQIVPGERAQLRMTFDNQAGGIVRNVIVRLDLTSSDIPIAPIDSMSEKKISSISTGGQKELIIPIVALSDADAGIYKVPITVSYEDDSGNSYTKEGVIGVFVGGVPDMIIQASSDTVKKDKSSGKVTFTFTNKGLTGVKFLNVKVNEGDNIKVFSAPEVYVGEVDSDDFETAEFDLYVGKAEDGAVMIPLSLEYRDTNNVLFKEDVEVPLRVFSGGDLRKIGGGTSPVGIIVVVLIVGAGLYLYWRRRKKKRK